MVESLTSGRAEVVEEGGVEHRTRELETLHRLGQNISQSIDSREVLERSLATIIAMGWFDCGEAYLKTSEGLQTVAVGRCSYAELESCPLRAALIREVEAIIELEGVVQRGGWQLLPINRQALLALSAGEASRAFLEAVTDLIGASLNRTNLHQRLTNKEKQRSRLLRTLMSAQEEERGRISRDLHDQIGQSLTAILLGLDESSGPLTPARLKKLKELASITLDDVRRIALDLRPSVLDELGLEAAIRRYARELKERFNLEVSVLVSLPQRLSSEEEIALYRVVQEALTNVVRHAGATQASVVITVSQGFVQLVVEDDGVGFDPATLLLAEQIGLVGMRERLELLGGSLRIESSAGEGCTVYARLPLRRSYAL